MTVIIPEIYDFDNFNICACTFTPDFTVITKVVNAVTECSQNL